MRVTGSVARAQDLYMASGKMTEVVKVCIMELFYLNQLPENKSLILYILCFRLSHEWLCLHCKQLQMPEPSDRCGVWG